MAALSPREAICLQALLVLSSALLLVGLFSPLLYLSKFWIFSSHTSLASAIEQLMRHGEWSLGLIILVFSVLFPLAKNIATFFMLRHPQHRKIAVWKARLSAAGKWSMLDVFIVALIISAAKLGAIAHAEARYGLYLLLSATLISLSVSMVVDRRV